MVPPCFQFLCIFSSYWAEWQKFFTHAYLFPSLSNFLLIRMHCSSVWRKWSLNISQLSWTTLPCTTWSHVILPRRSLKKLKLALLKSMSAILLVSLLPPQPVVNSTISCSLQPRPLPTFMILNSVYLTCKYIYDIVTHEFFSFKAKLTNPRAFCNIVTLSVSSHYACSTTFSFVMAKHPVKQNSLVLFPKFSYTGFP